MRLRFAVIQFPGVNCEYESVYALEKSGIDAEIYRWNCGESLDKYDGFLLPGGWSYDDRVRGGAIAAKDPIMDELKKQAKKGKVIIGICNGAQILLESGLIPNLSGKFSVDFALAPNINPRVTGYYCTWINLLHSTSKQTAFNSQLKHEQVLPVPIAHGEGRFVCKDEKLLERLEKEGQIVFKYCTPEGDLLSGFPTNPNGSSANIAGICNPEGNVLAMMPHPERSLEKRQLPGFVGDHEEAREAAPGKAVFDSIREHIGGKR